LEWETTGKLLDIAKVTVTSSNLSLASQSLELTSVLNTWESEFFFLTECTADHKNREQKDLRPNLREAISLIETKNLHFRQVSRTSYLLNLTVTFQSRLSGLFTENDHFPKQQTEKDKLVENLVQNLTSSKITVREWGDRTNY
jgi:hypothetical protein